MPAHSPRDPNITDKQYIRHAAEALSPHLPDNHGFILLTFSFGEKGRLNYASNAVRADAIAALKEFLLKAGAAEDWMQHLK